MSKRNHKDAASLLQRARWLFFFFTAMGITTPIPAVLEDSPSKAVFAAVAAAVILTVYWRALRTRTMSLTIDIVALVSFEVYLLSVHSELSQNVFFPCLFYFCLFGSPRAVYLRAAAWLTLVGIDHTFVEQVATTADLMGIFGAAVTSSVMQKLGDILGRQEQAVRRERLLSDAGRELVAMTTPDAVRQLAARSAHQLVEMPRRARSGAFYLVNSGERLTVGATAGDLDVKSFDFSSIDLEPVRSFHAEQAGNVMLIAPLYAKERCLGAIVLVAPGTIDNDIRDTLEALASIVTLTTDRIEQDTRFRHVQRLESVGRLAAGIAHEINTPIQFVSDNLYFISTSFESIFGLFDMYHATLSLETDPLPWSERIDLIEQAEKGVDLGFLREEVPQAIEQSLGGAQQVSKIVRAMKALGHPDQTEQRSADVNKMLTSMITVAGNELKYVATVTTDLAELPLVRCFESDLNQVFLNLLVNAAHAISGNEVGGRSDGAINVRTRVDGGDVVVEITDDGSGIPEHVRDHIFDPFFTTKDVGVGTGQGLALARALIVDRHQGKISFDTKVDEGTTFFVRLPIDGRTNEVTGTP